MTTIEICGPDMEDVARIEHLIYALQYNPALSCPISYNWHGTQELSESASLKIRLYAQLMQESYPEMSFGPLTQITFHHDYEQALSDAVGIDRLAPMATKEAGGLSVGMMVRVGDGVHLVMHESVALALAEDEIEKSYWAQHVVRHELCHVSDFVFKQSLVAKHPEKIAFEGFHSLMAPMAEALWDEFYANKYSTTPLSDPRTFLDLLRDTLPTIRKDVGAAILDFQDSHDLPRLLSTAKPKVKFVAQCFGYAAGSLAGNGVTLEEFAPVEYEMLIQFGLSDVWHQCFETLQELDCLRPNWETVLEIQRLFPACVSLFAGFGLEYQPYGDGAYVTVPLSSLAKQFSTKSAEPV